MTEQWRDVVGFEGLYAVSNKGNVMRKDHSATCGSRWGGTRVIHYKESRMPGWLMQGYLYVKLYHPQRKAKTIGIHRLVLEAFVGPCPEGMECCHNDGNPTNNCLENLRWDSYKKNMEDRERHGRHAKGSSSVVSKLTEKDIPAIRELLAGGEISMNQIGIRYGVDVATIRDVRDRRTWKHVE